MKEGLVKMPSTSFSCAVSSSGHTNYLSSSFDNMLLETLPLILGVFKVVFWNARQDVQKENCMIQEEERKMKLAEECSHINLSQLTTCDK